jgi:hypothetical protein
MRVHIESSHSVGRLVARWRISIHGLLLRRWQLETEEATDEPPLRALWRHTMRLLLWGQFLARPPIK